MQRIRKFGKHQKKTTSLSQIAGVRKPNFFTSLKTSLIGLLGSGPKILSKALPLDILFSRIEHGKHIQNLENTSIITEKRLLSSKKTLPLTAICILIF